MPLSTILSTYPSTDRAPRIAWQNLLADPTAVITPSSQVAGFEAINAWDGKEYTSWKPVSAGTHTLTVDFPASHVVDFLAVHVHNLHLTGGSISIQVDNGSGWVDCAAPFHPTTSAPFLVTFAAVDKANFRIVIQCTSAVYLGVIAFGRAMRMEHGCWQGSTPPWMAPIVEVTTTKSENGVLLGRSVKRLGVDFDMDFDYHSGGFVRDEWMPFVASAQAGPFFVQWNPIEYPGEVAFCWVDNPSKDLRPPRWTGPDIMAMSAACKGKVS